MIMRASHNHAGSSWRSVRTHFSARHARALDLGDADAVRLEIPVMRRGPAGVGGPVRLAVDAGRNSEHGIDPDLIKVDLPEGQAGVRATSGTLLCARATRTRPL